MTDKELSQLSKLRRKSDLQELKTLDPGISAIVNLLRAGGVETYESCQGGKGHAYPEPTVAFHGTSAAGWHALSVAKNNGMPVTELRRSWSILEGEPVGPHWELVFNASRLPAWAKTRKAIT